MKKMIQLFSSMLMLLLILSLIPGCANHRVIKRYSGSQAAEYLKGRIWADKYPQNRKQPYQVYYFDQKKEIGVHIRAMSSYKRMDEYFHYKAEADRLQFLFPHDDRKADTKYVIEQITPVGPFNLKLTLMNDPQEKGRRLEYFSNTAWGKSDGFALPEEFGGFSDN